MLKPNVGFDSSGTRGTGNAMKAGRLVTSMHMSYCVAFGVGTIMFLPDTQVALC